MKYTITINQYAVFTNGLINKTDFTDWAIIDYLKDFAIYKKAKRIVFQKEEYIWLNYNHLIVSLPLIKFKSKSALSQRINKLRQLGLIKTCQDKDNTLYFTFTDKLIDICFARQTDLNRIKAQNSTYPVKSSLTAQYKTKISIINPAPIYTKSKNINARYDLSTIPYRNRCGVNADNKDISFSSSSLKPKNRKPQIHPAPICTSITSNDSRNNSDTSLRENWCGVNADKHRLELKPLNTQKKIQSCLCEGAKRPKQSPTTTIFITGDCHANARNDNPSENSVPSVVKGFSSLNGNIWSVIDNIRLRGLRAQGIQNAKKSLACVPAVANKTEVISD
jgi:hypothetical protein